MIPLKRLVIIVDGGRIEDVLVNSEEPTEIMVVDFDKKTLDQSVLEELKEPYDFENVAALADIYEWEAFCDPKRVKEIFTVGCKYAQRGP